MRLRLESVALASSDGAEVSKRMRGLVRLGAFGIALAILASTAQAECVSAACNRQMTIFFWMAGGLGLLAVVILIMLFRAKWRRTGLWLLAAAMAVFAGIPLAQQGWMDMQQAAMERREILGQPPAMAERTPLVIAQAWGCRADACEAALRGRGDKGLYVVLRPALEGVDPAKPLAMADLPISHLIFAGEGKNPVQRVLTPAERQRAAGEIDYVILIGPVLDGYRYDPFALATTGALDPLLAGNPAVAGLGERAFVQLAMAPVEKGVLAFADLRLDLLELWFFGNKLGLPLGPDNWVQMQNAKPTNPLAVQSLCPIVDQEPDWFCALALR